MHRRMVAVVVCLAFVMSGCGARFKGHEETGTPAAAPAGRSRGDVPAHDRRQR